MVPTLFDKRGKTGLACPMILFGNSEILLDLVPNLGDFLVPLDLIFRKPGIDLVLPHDSVADAVHVQEVPIGFAAIGLVGVSLKILSMKTAGHHEEELIGVMLGGSGTEEDNTRPLFTSRSISFIPNTGFLFSRPVGFKIR